MRTFAKHEEIDYVHSESVHEVVPMQYTDESVDSTSKVLVSVMMSASVSFEVKHYDISRAYF